MNQALIHAATMAANISRQPGKLVILEITEQGIEVRATYRRDGGRSFAVHSRATSTWDFLSNLSDPSIALTRMIGAADAAVTKMAMQGYLNNEISEVENRINVNLRALSPPYDRLDVMSIITEYLPTGWRYIDAQTVDGPPQISIIGTGEDQ